MSHNLPTFTPDQLRDRAYHFDARPDDDATYDPTTAAMLRFAAAREDEIAQLQRDYSAAQAHVAEIAIEERLLRQRVQDLEEDHGCLWREATEAQKGRA